LGGCGIEFGQHRFIFGFARQSLLFLQFGFGGLALGDFGTVVNAIKVACRRQYGRRTSRECHGNCTHERGYPKTL
jgi:hypothetical protein